MRAILRANAVLGIAILVACSGSSGGEGGNGLPGPAPANGAGDTPPGDFDTPPGQDPPPPGFDDPSGPGGTTPPGGSGSCAAVCQGLIAHGCMNLGPDVTSCTSNCNAAIPTVDCGTELLALLSCAVGSRDFTCDALDGEFGQGQFPECATQALAYAQCTGNGGEGGQGGI